MTAHRTECRLGGALTGVGNGPLSRDALLTPHDASPYFENEKNRG